MTLDALLAEIRVQHLVLISERELWPSPAITGAIRRGLRRHRKGLATLIAWSSIDVCPSRDLHRRYWRYVGQGRYECEVCRQLLPAISDDGKTG